MALAVRTAREVAERLLVLAAISEAAHQQPPTEIRRWIDLNRMSHALSDWERSFLAQDNPGQDWLIAASWRVEACAVLSWALRQLGALPPATEQISLEVAGVTPQLVSDPGRFIEHAALRSENELSDLQMDIEALLWGIRAGPAGRKLFPNPNWRDDLNHSIVYQRLYAINWVVTGGEDWDSVTTDT